MRWAGHAYVVLLLLSAVAFWPGYVSQPMKSIGGWTHFHAAVGTLWLFALIAQPMAIHSGRRRLHRIIGRASYVLMPAVVISFVGLAHASMHGKAGPELATAAYYLYIRVVLVSIFVATYTMAIVNRRNIAVHARYMVCTGLALIDPVGHRIAHRLELHLFGTETADYQMMTFGLVFCMLGALIWRERHAKAGRHVFPVVLAAFFAGWLPLALEFYRWGAPWEMWKGIAARVAALPLP